MKHLPGNRYPIVIGFLITAILFAAVFPFVNLGTKYKLSVTKDLLNDPNYIYIYKDLFHDGNSGKIVILPKMIMVTLVRQLSLTNHCLLGSSQRLFINSFLQKTDFIFNP